MNWQICWGCVPRAAIAAIVAGVLAHTLLPARQRMWAWIIGAIALVLLLPTKEKVST